MTREANKWPADACCTLVAGFGKRQGYENQHVNSGCPAFVQGEDGIRRLTITEMERLMGLPDGHTEVANNTTVAQTKAIGNSMAVNCMAWIGSRIQDIVDEGG